MGVALVSILLLVVAVVVRLVELWEYLSHRLDELEWCEGLALAVQVSHEVPGSRGDQHIRVIGQALRLLV